MKLDNRQVITANHYQILPITPLVIATVNGWANRNQVPGATTYKWKDRDIQDWGEEEISDLPPARQPTPNTFGTDNAPAIPNPFPIELEPVQ